MLTRQNVIAEWAYSINYALTKFEYDNDFELFASVLSGSNAAEHCSKTVGELSEDVYSAQMKMIQNVTDTLAKKDIELNQKQAGKLDKAIVMATLRKFFEVKSDDMVADIQTVASGRKLS